MNYWKKEASFEGRARVKWKRWETIVCGSTRIGASICRLSAVLMEPVATRLANRASLIGCITITISSSSSLLLFLLSRCCGFVCYLFWLRYATWSMAPRIKLTKIFFRRPTTVAQSAFFLFFLFYLFLVLFYMYVYFFCGSEIYRRRNPSWRARWQKPGDVQRAPAGKFTRLAAWFRYNCSADNWKNCQTNVLFIYSFETIWKRLTDFPKESSV